MTITEDHHLTPRGELMTDPMQGHPFRYKLWFTGVKDGRPFLADMAIASSQPLTKEQAQASEAPKIEADHGLTGVTITHIETVGG